MFEDDIEILPKKRKIIINITSLIDVLFLLLIFFMVTSTFVKNSALKVSLPAAKGGIALEQKKSLDILIKDNDTILLNGSSIKFNDLSSKVLELKKNLQDENPDIHFKVDENVSYGFAIKVMGELKASGIKTIMAITQQEK